MRQNIKEVKHVFWKNQIWETQHMEDALPVKTVDTTCAGDTFNGFFLAGRLEGRNAADSMKLAAKAASITVSRPGAACSIPYRREL